MKIEKVQAFKTTNGKYFEDQKLAEMEQAIVDFDEWYYFGHCLHGNNGADVPAEAVRSWLSYNGEIALDLIKKYKKVMP